MNFTPSASCVGISPRCPFWTLRRPLCLLRRHLPRRGRRPIASTKHCYVRRFFPPLGGIKRGCMNQAEMLFASFVGISPGGGENSVFPQSTVTSEDFSPLWGESKGVPELCRIAFGGNQKGVPELCRIAFASCVGISPIGFSNL